jgi:hypothetical protein
MTACALMLCVAASMLLLACAKPSPESGVDMAALQRAMQAKTEKIYSIHLQLDSAAASALAAESAVQGGKCDTAGYEAADAYRRIETADQALLELGRELQELAGLDLARAQGE